MPSRAKVSHPDGGAGNALVGILGKHMFGNRRWHVSFGASPGDSRAA